MIDIANDDYIIVLSDGRPFSLSDPKPEDIDILHIAHALSNICRWTGQVKTFYSVAEHCLDVAWLVPPELELTGLLHDASEAYIGDIASPLKWLLADRAPGVLREIEDNIHRAISKRFGTVYPFPPEIKHADKVAAATERRDLIPGWQDHGISWSEDWPEPMSRTLLPLASPRAARYDFLTKYLWLT